MLTKAQIKAAQFWAHSLADPEIDRDLEARGVIDGALAAYERVVALRSELVDFMASSYARPKFPIEDVLRKLDEALGGK